ncbi:hypothetical protein J9303_07275 [Bacillaceae bacterium Marseille-Q3522]|nr:hypothetical protein [Bacillaceae bacterium Marseille-Q3522]
MSNLTIVKIVMLITVLGLFAWAINTKTVNYETFKFAKYIIYLLVFEVVIVVLFSFL